MTETIKHSLVGRPEETEGRTLFDAINFIPIQECPFFEFQPAMTDTSTMSILIETQRVEEDGQNWDAVLGTVIPTILIACLISTCYLCYR